jgi:outer membrane protein
MKTRDLKLWSLVSAFILLSSTLGFAQQKIGWIDTQEIMKKLPEAIEAQTKLDAFVSQWQTEINKMQSDLQQESDDYQRRRLILPEQARIQEEQKLSDMQKKIMDLRNQRFGPNGDLAQQQNTIMRPVQEKVLQAIQDVAKEGDYDYIFDKSGQVLLMYSNPKYDLTQQVLDKLKIPSTTTTPGTIPPSTNPQNPGQGIH